MTAFSALGVHKKYIQALKELGISHPTEIQQKALPILLNSKTDFIGLAQTGTGKTVAFGLPLLHQIDANQAHIQALILSPTRELVQQIKKQLFKFTKFSEEKIYLEAVFGGEKIDKQLDGSFIVTTDKGTAHHTKVVAIAGGLGSFEPKKPLIEGIESWEDKGVSYMIKDPEVYRDKKVLIAGGGDSALDWSIFLAEVASEVTLVHRRSEFRGALDSVEKVQALKNSGKINLITPAEVIGLAGDTHLNKVYIQKTGEEAPIELTVDAFIPLFGLSPKLGPIGAWGLEIEKNAIVVDNTLDYMTNIPGVYAIGDVNTYPGKLKLILCGFHEATLMCQSAYGRIFPDKRYVMKYTTVGGVTGFDGTKKEAPKAVVKKIE